MKKFLTRAMPLCLALLIFVGSLAVPAFAASNETYTLTGTWKLNDEIDLSYADASSEASFIFICDDLVYLSMIFSPDGLFAVSDDDPEQAYDFECETLVIEGMATVDADFYRNFLANFTRVDAAAILADSENTISIFSVFGGISGWIVTAIGTIMPMFYTQATGLTFIGTLAVAALAFAVIFLIIAIIRRFLHFGG